MSDLLTDAVVAAAEHVPREHITRGAAAVEGVVAWSAQAQAALLSASPAAEYRQHAERVARAWATVPQRSGAAVAAALEAAAAAVETVRGLNRVSLVWTGPPTQAVGLRSTRAVVGEIVARAASSLVLVSFASYKVDDLAAALLEATRRGVTVSLILETQDDGGLTVDAAKAFTTLKGHARFYRWPLEARRAYFADSARLHAKCIVADRSVAFITSANLTGAGINDNIELGVLIEAGPLPATLHDHLELLIHQGIVESAP